MSAGHSHDGTGHGRVQLHAQERSGDPTRTKTVRRTYGQRLRGAFARINTAIREGIVENDVLGLSDAGLQADVGLTAEVDLPPDLSTFDEGERIRRFEDWLDEAMDSEVLDVIDRDGNRFIEHAYERALKDADVNLERAGIAVNDAPAVEAALQVPVHERKLQALFARNYAELDGITDEVARQVTRELADGMGEGVNPREMARRITDRVDKIGKTRATTLARTEVINAYSEATLTRFEELDVEEVVIRAEISTAGDGRVCPVCQALEGQTQEDTLTIEGVREETFRFDPDDSEIVDSLRGQYRKKPPIHPQCRCVILPVGSATARAAYRERPEAYLSLFAAGAFRRRVDPGQLVDADDDDVHELVARHGNGPPVAG